MATYAPPEVRGRAGTRYYPIPTHLNYGITNLGDVMRYDTMERIDWDVDDDKHIFIRFDDGDRRPIQQVLAWALLGVLDAPIITGTKVYDGGRIRYTIVPSFLKFDPPNVCFICGKEFRLVPQSAERVYASEDGALFDVLEMALLRRKYNIHDTLCCFLKDGNGNRILNYVSLAKLIYTAWVGPIGYDERIEFVDGNPHNVHLENLHRLSSADVAKTILMKNGSVKGMPRWTYEDMEEAAELMSKGFTCSEISYLLGVPNDKTFRMALERLRSGENYYECGSKYNYDLYHAALNASNFGHRAKRQPKPDSYYDVAALAKLAKNGMSFRQISSYIGMPIDDVRTVVNILRNDHRDYSRDRPYFLTDDKIQLYREIGFLPDVVDQRDGGLDRAPDFFGRKPEDTEPDFVIDLGEPVEAQDVVITLRQDQKAAREEAEAEGREVVVEESPEPLDTNKTKVESTQESA